MDNINEAKQNLLNAIYEFEDQVLNAAEKDKSLLENMETLKQFRLFVSQVTSEINNLG